jgi:hypothetical protein
MIVCTTCKTRAPFINSGNVVYIAPCCHSCQPVDYALGAYRQKLLIDREMEKYKLPKRKQNWRKLVREGVIYTACFVTIANVLWGVL